MAIDESAGLRDRKDAVVTSSAMSLAMATLLVRPTSGLRADTAKALVRRGWIERRPHPEQGTWAHRYHLTDAGRAVAVASPAVQGWIDGWAFYRKRED